MKQNLLLFNFKKKKVADNKNAIVALNCEEKPQKTCEYIRSCTKNTADSCKLCNLHLFLSSEWYSILRDEFRKDYYKKIVEYLHQDTVFYPPAEKIFYFSHFFALENTKVVILGQDPYHNKGRATGLAFSVPADVPLPPSLRNIYAEVKRCYKNATCDLEQWARQGVLLLNDTLTVCEAKPGSHSTYGWSMFTDKILEVINKRCNNVVFMLWGLMARKKDRIINKKKHLVLTSTHPSPFSAERGFNGCSHFVKANEYFRRKNIAEICW